MTETKRSSVSSSHRQRLRLGRALPADLDKRPDRGKPPVAGTRGPGGIRLPTPLSHSKLRYFLFLPLFSSLRQEQLQQRRAGLV